MTKRAGATHRRPSHGRSNRPLQHLPPAASSPDLVPRLQPVELHQLILARGLDDAGELIAQATPAQIAQVFDLDLWRPSQAGGDEQLDGSRFAEWLEVLVESGTLAAALAGVNLSLIAAAFAQHVRVFDRAVVDPYVALDGELTPTGYAADERTRGDVGGYVVFARRTDTWDAVFAGLLTLEHADGQLFGRLMRGCAALSNAGREIDGLDDLPGERGQAMFDLAADRDDRRAVDGYVAPARARVFLDSARRRLPVTDTWPGEPGLLPVARDADPLRTANERLAMLANTLMAGTGIQGRRFEPEEAASAALAVCTLGFESWPGGQVPAPDDLAAAFQAGWTLLYEEVCMYTADRLLLVLGSLPPRDVETELALRAFRKSLGRHLRAGTPWRVREDLDVLAPFDLLVPAALRGLIDELPVLPAAVPACLTASTRPVSASAFEFISSRAQIHMVHDFVDQVGERLR